MSVPLSLDRRAFAQLASALFVSAALGDVASAQQTGTMDHPVMGSPSLGPAAPKAGDPLPELASGVYRAGAWHGSQPGRKSHTFVNGMLKAGNIQMEIHETRQEVGAPHEPTGTHLHNELWLVREGTCELTTNGVTRRMQAGEIGICCAGDEHYIRNAGDTPCTYFVVTVGPPEPRKR